jgi:hypothetical protein
MTAAVTQGTVDGVMEYIDFLIEKGYAPSSAVSPWKSAVRTVFSTVEGEGKDYGKVDVRGLDIEEYMTRYGTLVRGKLKQESVVAYRQRVTRAIESYREYLDNPDGWRPPSVRRSSRRAVPDKVESGNGGTATKSHGPHTTEGAPSNGHGNGNGSSLIDYPFPLRTGQIAHVRLPSRLDRNDADRLAAFIRTLVFDPQLELPEKTGTEGGE